MVSILDLIIFGVVVLFCEMATPIGERLALVDRPDNLRKIHAAPTPLVGGLAMLPAFCLAAIYAAAITSQDSGQDSGIFLALLVTTCAFWLLGFADDRQSIAPTHRLLITVALFGLAMAIEPSVILTELDFGPGFPVIPLEAAAVPFTLLCAVGFLNAVNMADGKNGLVLALSIYWVYSLSLFAPAVLNLYLGFIGLSLFIVFIYNRFGRLFLGDSGSYLVGAAVGLLMVYVYNHAQTRLPVTIFILWLLVPVLDCLRLMVERVRAGRSPFSADSNHLHHHLSRHRSWRYGFILYLALACSPGLVAMLWIKSAPYMIALAVGAYFITLRLARSPSPSVREALPGTEPGGVTPPSCRSPSPLVREALSATEPGVVTRPSCRSAAVEVWPAGTPSVWPAAKVQQATRRLLFIVNDTKFFASHRLPLGIAARCVGYDVHLAALDDGELDLIRGHGITHHPLRVDRTGTNPLHEADLLLQLWLLVRWLRPAIMHCVTIKPVIYGGLVARCLGVPALVSAISGLGLLFVDGNGCPRHLQLAAARLYRTALAHRNSRVIFQNPDDRKQLVGAGVISSEHAVLIRGAGVDMAVYQPTPELRGVPVVVLPARLLWEKGVQEFVEAARIVREAGMKARFVLVGEAPAHNRASVPAEMLRRWVDSGLVEWWGFRRDMPEVYKQSHIVCLPSYYREGIPKALIEAAACGRSIVTTAMPGCREVVRHGENGFLVPPRAASALADALLVLLRDRERRRTMGARGREIAVAEFSLDRVVGETLTLYRELHP